MCIVSACIRYRGVYLYDHTLCTQKACPIALRMMRYFRFFLVLLWFFFRIAATPRRVCVLFEVLTGAR